ncbi:hypothetical protein [Niabella ginsengisoli]|uniref:Lipoprotein n=1 Tax=Niabella ginsengisoli TaxID=522298 RepID=A0ABS9SGJ0_9BACT|nr:hypothetical protein [Niabella ginsengisoli]MCH5597483.1 hypothetical protein [Niabella ginsengisoli]
MKKYFYIVIFTLLAACGQTNNKTNKNNATANSGNDTLKSQTSNESIDTSPKNSDEKNHLTIPENYSELKESPSNGRKMERILADLDDDKLTDTALIVENTADFANYLLLVYLSGQDETFQMRFFNENEMNMYPVQLAVKKNVLEVGYFLDGTAGFGRFLKLRFDETKKKMKLIGYDTGYKKGGAGSERLDKSFNLLTGDYVVKLQKLVPKIATETFKGNKKIESIYMEDIGIETLLKLDEIGSEFE